MTEKKPVPDPEVALREQVAVLTARIEATDAAKFEAEGLLAQSLTRSAELNAHLRKANSAAARFQAQLADRDRENDELRAQLADRDQDLQDLQRMCRDLRDALPGRERPDAAATD